MAIKLHWKNIFSPSSILLSAHIVWNVFACHPDLSKSQESECSLQVLGKFFASRLFGKLILQLPRGQLTTVAEILSSTLTSYSFQFNNFNNQVNPTFSPTILHKYSNFKKYVTNKLFQNFKICSKSKMCHKISAIDIRFQ